MLSIEFPFTSLYYKRLFLKLLHAEMLMAATCSECATHNTMPILKLYTICKVCSLMFICFCFLCSNFILKNKSQLSRATCEIENKEFYFSIAICKWKFKSKYYNYMCRLHFTLRCRAFICVKFLFLFVVLRWKWIL